MRRHADRLLRHRKARDRAIILLLIGAAFFLPPAAAIFHMEAMIAGIPLPVIGIFGVWIALVAVAAALAPRLVEAGQVDEFAPGPDLDADPDSGAERPET